MARNLIIVKTPPGALAPDAIAEGRAESREEEREARFDDEMRVAAYWEKVRAELLDALAATGRDVSLEGVRIFQEGLCSGAIRGMKIASDLAIQGNRNYQLILELVKRGAKLEKTEDPNLLWEEYHLLRAALSAPRLNARVRAREFYREKARDLIASRDKRIAARIDRVVGRAELGVLFIGAEHDIARFVPPSFDVTILPGASPTSSR